MLSVLRPKARAPGSKGFTITTKGDDAVPPSPVTPDESHGNPFVDNDRGNPFVDDSRGNPFVARTPGAENGAGGSAFAPISPPKIQRKARASDDFQKVFGTPQGPLAPRGSKDGNEKNPFTTPRGTLPSAKGGKEKNPFDTPRGTKNGKENRRSPCDATQELSPHTPDGSPPPPADDDGPRKNDKKGRKAKGNAGRVGAALRDQVKDRVGQVRRSLPKKKRRTKSMNKRGESGDDDDESKRKPADLADLALPTMCLTPRHGAGIAAGRRPFERARTSLMLHMVRECENSPQRGPSEAANDGSDEKKEDENGEGERDGDNEYVAAGLNLRLRNCVGEEGTRFVEKGQEAVRLAKDALEELDGRELLPKNEIGQRNLTCIKFLSGMYREVVADEQKIASQDGLSLMVIANAHYALGKFEPALSLYQRAGVELKKRIATSHPEHTVHCAKLFNNMGCVYFEMNKFEKAMRTFQRALQLFHDDHDEDDHAAWSAAILDQASVMNNMAYLLIKFKQYDDASDLVDASFELQQMLPPGNTNATMTISTLSTMAFVYYRTEEYRASLDTYAACVQLQDKSPLCSESDQVEVLKKMADICRKIRDHEKRVYLLRTILVYQQCYLLEDDDEIWDTHAALAETLQAFADSGGTSI